MVPLCEEYTRYTDGKPRSITWHNSSNIGAPMAATSEEGRGKADPSPSSDDSPLGRRGGEAQQASAGDGKAQEKTISCVSCRKRKLKCDRIKPKCGTCTRLRHECEYPERRRTLGSKRRNMKELEARLGMNIPSRQERVSLTVPSTSRNPTRCRIQDVGRSEYDFG
jgi:hypothetical protein